MTEKTDLVCELTRGNEEAIVKSRFFVILIVFFVFFFKVELGTRLKSNATVTVKFIYISI